MYSLMKLDALAAGSCRPCLALRQTGFQLLVICLSVTRALPALAQAHEDPTHSSAMARPTMEQVIVTARKREESLQDVPISVSAFTAEDMAARSAGSLSDLANATPNFSFQSSGVGTALFIRGVGQSDGSVFFDPGVGIYVDGVYLPRMRGVDLDLIDFSRVEVLRGPQGTLFGRNTIGGALNITSRRPGQELSGAVEATVGRYSRMDANASIDLPMAPGTLVARLSAATRNRDGYGKRLDFNTGEKIGETGTEDVDGARAVFAWTPRKDIDVLITVDGSQQRNADVPRSASLINVPGPIVAVNNFVDPDVGPAMVTGNPYTTYGNGSNYGDSDTWGVSVNAFFDAGDWSFRSISSYRDLDFAYGIDPDNTPHDIFDQTFEEFSQTYTQEFQLAGVSMNEHLNWITGLYFFKEDSGMSAQTLLLQPLYVALGQDRSLYLVVDSDAESWAAFGQGTYSLTDKLGMTVGLRYNNDKKTVTRGRYTANQPDVITLPFETLSDTWDAMTGRADIQYQWTDDVMTYLSASRGYKSGGVNGAGLAGATTAFDPEFIWTYELGLRSELMDRRLRFNVSAFKSEYSDLQFRVTTASPSGAPIAIVDNAAKARIQGFEAELTAIPTAGLELSGSVGYIDAKYSRLNPGTPVTLNDKFPLVPEWSYMLAAQYTLPLGSSGDLTGRLDYSHKSGYPLQATNSPLAYQDGFGYVNGRLSFRSGNDRWELAAFVTNITDEVIAISGAAQFVSSFGFVEKEYAPPRQWGVSVRYAF